MLVDHPYSVGDRIVWILDRCWFAIHQDLAAIGVIKPISDPHDGRLTGTVLAHDRMYRAFMNSDRNVIVRDHGPKSLGYISKFQHVFTWDQIWQSRSLSSPLNR